MHATAAAISASEDGGGFEGTKQKTAKNVLPSRSLLRLAFSEMAVMHPQHAEV